MTDRELMEMALLKMEYMLNNGEWYKPEETIKAIRARLAQPEPEPELWGCKFNKGNRVDTFYTKSAAERYVEGSLRSGADVSLVGLYTAPPQREWQGLTAAERIDFINGAVGWMDVICAIEAKLKEKNT